MPSLSFPVRHYIPQSLYLIVESTIHIINRNKLKFLSYLTVIILSALIVSFTFGENFNPKEQKHRGLPRRQVREAKSQLKSDTTSSSSLKDPFPNRPRIRTKNGHIVIEASQDKNIDFRTSGSRGTITINGFKIDQLLDVTKALEKSALSLNKLTSNSSSSSSSSSSNQPSYEQYERTMNELLTSGGKLSKLQKLFDNYHKNFLNFEKNAKKLLNKLKKNYQNLNEAQDLILLKLKKNDCFDQETGLPTCKNGATCLDTYDGFKCLCPQQFEGLTCELDIDECSKYHGTDLGCQNGAKCINFNGGYRCECTPQYHGVHCTEQHDDCSLSSSKTLCGYGKCINLVRQLPNQPHYECICDQGWTTDGSNPACIIDINECLAGSNSLTYYNNTDLQLKQSNYYNNNNIQQSVPWANSLMAAYPCSQNPFVECINLPGSFQCGPCPPGYTGNGRVCRDIDECASSTVLNGGCSTNPLVECINTMGSRRCGQCPAGFTGDGITCSRISACSQELNGGCHPMATCHELTSISLTERICICPYPLVGDGIGMMGCVFSVDGSKTIFGNDSSSALNGTTNTIIVNVQPELQQQQQQQDDCNPNPCLNNAECLRTDNSFECLCSTNWMGKLCDEKVSICGGKYYVSKGEIKFPLSGSFNELIKLNDNNQIIADNPQTMIDDQKPLTSLVQDNNNKKSVNGGGDRHYNCQWSIVVQQNMSIQLNINELMNKINPTKKIQMYLANLTSSTQPPICDEYLDIREHLEDSFPLDMANLVMPNKRLLARFCIDITQSQMLLNKISSLNSPITSFSQIINNNNNNNNNNNKQQQPLIILSESNFVELEYSFSATRTQFGEPSLMFNLTWLKIDPPCGGRIIISDNNNNNNNNNQQQSASGFISSPKFPEFYKPGTECRWFLQAQANNRIRIQFGELNLLMGRLYSSYCSDSLTILDGSIGSHRRVLFKHCANNATFLNKLETPKPVISSSSTIEIILYSKPSSIVPLMKAKQKKGFYLTYATELNLSPGCGGLFTTKSGTIKSSDYENVALEEAAASNNKDEFLFGYLDDNYNNNYNDPRIAAQLSNLIKPGNQTQQQDKNSRVSNQQQQQQQQRDTNKVYLTRCEYEIRPANQGKNHKISIDFVEMPSNTSTASIMKSLSGFALKNKNWRKDQCNKNKLTIYDGNPLDNSNRTELATFCMGDKYDQQLSRLNPIISSGHVLYLVYESSLSPALQEQSSSSSSLQNNIINKPGGFKLQYSTICSAIYNQLESRIQVDLDNDINECVYHIILPINNTISLLIEPKMSESMILPDGSCAAQAIFMDGAISGGKFSIIKAERQLRTYNFDKLTNNLIKDENSPSSSNSFDNNNNNNNNNNEQIGVGNTRAGSVVGATGSELNNNDNQQQEQQQQFSNNTNSYWQYSSSQSHDIKEFEVCKLPVLTFDSIWNHLSLLFRLKNQQRSSSSTNSQADENSIQQQQQSSSSSSSSLAETVLSSENKKKIQLFVRYQAEPSCGGIITEPLGKGESIKLAASSKIESIKFFPLTVNRYEQLHRQEFVNSCAWILKSLPNQIIKLAFEIPQKEIQSRFTDYLQWLKKGNNSNQLIIQNNNQNNNNNNNSNDQIIRGDSVYNRIVLSRLWGDYLTPASSSNKQSSSTSSSSSSSSSSQLENNLNRFDCNQVFMEQIELYEPELNRTRLLCPIDLIEQANLTLKTELNNSSSNLLSPIDWLTQSSIVYIRLKLALTNNNNNSTSNVGYPGRFKPLNGSINLNYKFISSDLDLKQCGGKIIHDSGIINSPRFPFSYPSSANCQWLIQAQEGQQIRLNFTKFNIGDCADYLELRNGPMNDSPLIGTFCDKELQSKIIISHSRFINIKFHSDRSVNFPGFELYFDGAQTGCGGKLTSSSGQIDSPNYPQPTLHSSDCEWIIEVSQSNKIELTIEELDLSSSSSMMLLDSNNSNNCLTNGTIRDYLEIFDSGNEQFNYQTKSIGRFCHKSQLNWKKFISSTNKLYLIYKSQALDLSKGFRLTYKTLCSGIELNSLQGIIESPGYPDSSIGNSKLICDYLIKAPLGSNLTIIVSDLKLRGKPSSGTKLEKDYLNMERNLCVDDHLEIWPIYMPFLFLSENLNKNNSTTTISELNNYIKNKNNKLLLEFNQIKLQSNNFRRLNLNGPKYGKLARSLCGNEINNQGLDNSMNYLTSFNNKERFINDLNTNIVYINFESYFNYNNRGFRLEWQSFGCGSQAKPLSWINYPDDRHSIESIKYFEPKNLLKPTECFWFYDINTKDNNNNNNLKSSTIDTKLEIQVNSDMRNSLISKQSKDNYYDPCQDGSLTIYDGKSESDPILSKNCDSQIKKEILQTSTGYALIKFYSSGRGDNNNIQSFKNQRSFEINAWPSYHDPCMTSVYDIRTPFNKKSGEKKSPNYPDLYLTKSYRCFAMLAASNGRLKLKIEELNIPTNVDDNQQQQQQQSSLLDKESCKKSGNYLLIRSLISNQLEEYYCGKLDNNNNNNNLINRQTIVFDHESVWTEFNTKNELRGRWKYSYSRLCGSTVQVDLPRFFSTPNYPNSPNWQTNIDDSTTTTTTSGGESIVVDLNNKDFSENVCIWKLKTNYLYGNNNNNNNKNKSTSDKKIHLNIINFVQSNRINESPSDCLRIYEGVDISLRQFKFNLTELDTNFSLKPKLKICKQSDLKYSNLFYISQGSELIVLISGNTIVKFRARPFENHCGGEFHLKSAEFASLNYPQPYFDELDCNYFIIPSPGSKINLKFNDFDLPEGEELETTTTTKKSSNSLIKQQQQINCDNSDYVEIRLLPTIKKLKARLNIISDLAINGNTYKSTNVGRLILYEKQMKKLLELKEKEFNNNNNNNKSQQQLELDNLIQLKNKLKFIELSKLYTFFAPTKYENTHRWLYHMSLSLRLNEFYEFSTLLGRFCGKKNKLPKLPDSLRGELLIRFRSHAIGNSQSNINDKSIKQSIQPKGFLAEYKVQYGGLIKFVSNNNNNNNNDDDDDDEILKEGDFISSPNYPNSIQFNDSILWTFETNNNFIFEFDLISLQLGSLHKDCDDVDSLNIYDGLNIDKSVKLAKLCGQLKFNDIKEAEQFKFKSSSSLNNNDNNRKLIINNSITDINNDNLINDFAFFKLPNNQAFNTKVKLNLLRTIRTTTNVATIIYNNFKSEANFLLRYRAISRKLINQNNLKAHNNESLLLENYSKILDENEALENNNNNNDVVNNQTSNATINDLNSKTKSCSKTYQLIYWPQNKSQIILTSPDWPKEPPKDIDCHWLIYTQENTNIRLTIDAKSYNSDSEQQQDNNNNSFDQNSIFPWQSSSSSSRFSSDYCFKSEGPRNFVSIYDGTTRLSPLIGRYCLPMQPIQLESTGRHLLIRYVHATTNIDNPTATATASSSFDLTKSLFRAKASIGECGGQYYVTTSAKISSGNAATSELINQNNKQYSNNLNCKYFIFSSNLNEVLILHNELSEFDLSLEPTNSNCTIGDYIEIKDLPIQSDLMDDYLLAPATGKSSSSSIGAGRSLGRFCAGKKLEYLESPGSAILIEFHTDSSNVARGFELLIRTGLPKLNCPRGVIQLSNQDLQFGRFSSPNWPHGFYGNRQCRYLFVAPINQTIEVTFLRLRRQTSSLINNIYSETSSSSCSDDLYYLADNEAEALRYTLRPLKTLEYPFSVNYLKKLIKEFPCKKKSTLTNNFVINRKLPTYFDSLAKEIIQQDSLTTTTTTTSTLNANSNANGNHKKLSPEDYYRLLADYNKYQTSNSLNGFTIKTDSHVLLIDFEAKNLLPNEGFLALFRVSDERRNLSNCGGDVLPNNNNNNNLIESALFNKELNLTDDFIQCDFNLKTKLSNSYLSNDFSFNGNKRFSFENLIEEHQIETKELSEFKSAFIVFQVLEIPPTTATATNEDIANNAPSKRRDNLFNFVDWYDDNSKKTLDSCGLNRILLSDLYNHRIFITCGNATLPNRNRNWFLLDYALKKISIRTKNVKLTNNNNNNNIFYRGVRAFLYEKSCLQIETIINQGFRIRSHRKFNLISSSSSSSSSKKSDYNNNNNYYEPGICSWNLFLNGGDYEISFDKILFRQPKNFNSSLDLYGKLNYCDLNKLIDLDYLELRASIDYDSPVLARYCFYNQIEYNNRKLVKILNTRSELTILFVSGIEQLTNGNDKFNFDNNNNININYGFDMEIIKVKNDTNGKFCTHDIYKFINPIESDYYDFYSFNNNDNIQSTFLYPKNVHCEIYLNIEDNLRFNFTFKGIFDLEQSKDCSADYLQIDDLMPTGTTTTTTNLVTANNNNNNNNSILSFNGENSDNKLNLKRIARWCGRTKPSGWFKSETNQVKITFHSNEQVAGKGFQLEYNTFKISNNNNNNNKTIENSKYFDNNEPDLY